MAKFRDLPTHNMLVHTDAQNRIIDSEQHQLTQGWTQAFSDLSSVLNGDWVRTSPNSNSVSNCVFTPWLSNIHLVFTSGGVQNVKFTKRMSGVLTLLDSSMNIKEYVSVSGAEISVNVNTGDVLFGSLTTGV